MVRREGTGSIPCWVSACMMAVTPPPVPLWRNASWRDTMACTTCAGMRSESAGVVSSVPGPRRDWRHHSASATCRASFSRRPSADRCPRSSRRPGIGREPGADGVLCVAAWAFPFPVESVLLRAVFVLDVLAHVIVRTRLLPGVDAGTPVHAQRFETRAPVPAGAGVGV